jgi:hypothetical protein
LRSYVTATLLILGLSGCHGAETTRDRGASRTPEAVLALDPGKVPADLRDLVPLAQRWGIGDDVERSERVQRSTEVERAQLRAAFGPRAQRITAWLDSYRGRTMPDEPAAFMYTQLAIEEMPESGGRQ